MQDDLAKLKVSLTELSGNLKVLKTKNEILVTKLGLLKDRLETPVPPVTEPPVVEGLPVQSVVEVIQGGGIKDGLVHGAIQVEQLKNKEAKTFYTNLYLLNTTQQEDGGNADKLIAFTDHSSYGALTDFSKDDKLIKDQDAYFNVFIAGLKDLKIDVMHEIKLLCQDYIKTLENIYGPYEKIWNGELKQEERYAAGQAVAPIDSSTSDKILGSMSSLVADDYVNGKAGEIAVGHNVELNQKYLQAAADYITKAISEDKVSDSKVLERLLPMLTMRTQSLIVSYALLSNNYSEQLFLQWSTGAILWYTGQIYRGAKKYKNLSVVCLSHLIKVMTKITENFDVKIGDIRLGCNKYTSENALKVPKVEITGVTTNSYIGADKGFTFEGRTVKRQLLSLIWAIKCLKAIDKELDERPKDVVKVADPIVNNVLDNTPADLLTTPVTKMNAQKYGLFLKEIYMHSCDALKNNKDIGLYVHEQMKQADVFYVLNGILSDFNEAMKQVKDKGEGAIKGEFGSWRKAFAYCDGIVKNIFKSMITLEDFVQQTKDPKVITKFIEFVGSILRYNQSVFDFEAANKELDPKYKMNPVAGFKCDDENAVKNSPIYKYKGGKDYNILSFTIVFVGVVYDLNLFEQGLDIILSDGIKMGLKSTLVCLCREALKENLERGVYSKYFGEEKAKRFIVAVKTRIKKPGGAQPLISELKTVLKIK